MVVVEFGMYLLLLSRLNGKSRYFQQQWWSARPSNYVSFASMRLRFMRNAANGYDDNDGGDDDGERAWMYAHGFVNNICWDVSVCVRVLR